MRLIISITLAVLVHSTNAATILRSQLKAACNECKSINFPTFIIIDADNSVIYIDSPQLIKFSDPFNGGVEANAAQRLKSAIDRLLLAYGNSKLDHATVPQLWKITLENLATHKDQESLLQDLQQSTRKIVAVTAGSLAKDEVAPDFCKSNEFLGAASAAKTKCVSIFVHLDKK